MSELSPNQVVRLERRGDVAVIKIDNPPINAGSTPVRRGLLAAVREFAEDISLTGAVIIGAGRWFMAGSDMREINSPVLDPPLPVVISAIEQCPKPVVAAIAGGALGGGYELSLGCDARVAAPGAVVGLPECRLGMMPGAGGTQRLPRLAGLPISIGLICSGARVDAARAVEIGMIDKVVDGDLLEGAVAYLRGLGGAKRRAMEIPPPACDPDELARAKAAALSAGGDRPHIRLAIEAIETCLTLPGDEALRAEREVFNQLRTGREAAAMLHLFFAERNAGKIPELKGVSARAVHSIAVVGSTSLAGELATALREAGRPVVQGPGGADLAQADVIFEASASGDGRRANLALLAARAAAGAILVICNPDPSLDGLANDFGDQRNIVRLYLVGPAKPPKIAELVMSPPIDPADHATVLALLAAIGIVTVAVGETQGSVAERVLDACRRECAALRERGTPSADIDLALKSFGLVTDLPGQQAPQIIAGGGRAAALARRQILELCLAAMANEAALLVSDGVVRDPALIDLLLVEGHAFPRHEGGVTFWARHQARPELDAVMQRLAETGGERFRLGPVERLLAEATPV